MDFDTGLFAIRFHGVPILSGRRVGFYELIPRDRVPAGGYCNHFNATVNGANVVAEAAANTIIFPHLRLRAHAARIEVNARY